MLDGLHDDKMGKKQYNGDRLAAYALGEERSHVSDHACGRRDSGAREYGAEHELARAGL